VIRHLLKLVWRRKRSTALLMLEIAVSFLVVFGVAALAMQLADNWRRPLGFDWHDVWVLRVDTNSTSDDTWQPQQMSRMTQLIAEARRLPAVEGAAGAVVLPYVFDRIDSNVYYAGRSPRTLIDEVTDDFGDVMRTRLVAGRWFDRQDDGAAVAPVVLNRRFAHDLFGDEDPLGKQLERGQQKLRVVGVVEDFRQLGELATPGNYMFTRIVARPDVRPPQNLLLRMSPGTTADYEQTLIDRLAPLAPGWSLSVQPLSALRHGSFRFRLAPLIVGAVIAAFLLLMVALGLLGVLWQNVTRRTRELGLRRAAGASRAAVHRQVLLELFLTTSVAVVPALVLVLQLPMLFSLPATVMVEAIVIGLLVVYALSALCGLYPSRIATRMPPAEALRWQ
jgi:putative ABC transport system permease protein